MILVLFGIPMVLCVAAIKLDSPGPALYFQKRSGKNGKPFHMIKLRTMVADAHDKQSALRPINEVDGPMFKIENDPRVTRVGKFLRKTCLDEVPQVINVLLGDMSLVGPRPLAPREMTMAPAWCDIRLAVKPGMTGLWQIAGRSHLSFGDWIRYDIEYVKRQSLALDIKILFKTALLVVMNMLPTRRSTSAVRDHPSAEAASASL